jgi:hypothetical protein
MYAAPQKTSTTKPSQQARPSVPFFQRQITLGKANDPAEKEADQIADRVVEGRKAEGAFFSAAPPPPPIINRQKEEQEEELQRKEEGTAQTSPSADFGERLNQASAKGGRPLAENTRREMEGSIGADFSNVRVHTDSTAAGLSQEVNAKAFTYGNDIFFNQGYYQTDTKQGKHLLAHELTHTVQQGASSQGKQTISRKPKRIQRGLLDGAWDAVSGAVNDVVEWSEDQLQAGIDWVKEQAVSFVANIPGYTALTVALAKDPVTGKDVPRNGLNFIRAAISIIPGGTQLEQKLNENGALTEAGTWLDGELQKLDLNLSGITSELAAIWRSLSISDVRNARGVLQRVANVFTSRLSRLTEFCGRVAKYFLQLVKSYVIKKLAEFVKARTRAYPLMTLALGYDPISGEEVDRTPMAILEAVLGLTENGAEVYDQLMSSGALERAIAYMTSVASRAMAIATLARKNALAAWELVNIENLMSPVETFTNIVDLVAQPALQAVALVAEVVRDFLLFVKDALLSYLGSVADELPGFTLLTVIMKRNPFTGKKVARTPHLIIRGFFELFPGGRAYYNQLQETGAIDRMLKWILGAVADYVAMLGSIVTAFQKLWNGFSWSDLANPLDAFKRVLDIVAQPLKKIFAFYAKVLFKVIEIVLTIMNFPIDLVKSILINIKEAYTQIKKDPIAFLKNMLRALKQGFILFFDNIGTHLITGLMDWLLGTVEDAGIKVPSEITPMSIFNMILDILGISVERIWEKIKKKLGPEKTAKLEKIISVATGVWKFVNDVMTRGPIAIWDYIKEKLENLQQIVFDAAKGWIMTKVIQEVTIKLLSLLDPTGIMAVVNSFIAFFRAVQTFIEQLTRMLEVINNITKSFLKIALGNIAEAAAWIEQTMVKSLPVMIAFLANQAGLGSLGKKIGEVLQKVRDKVDEALDWIIDNAIKLGGNLLNMAKAGVAAVSNWWKNKKELKTKDGHEHSLQFQGSGTSAKLMVASTPTPIKDFVVTFQNQNGLKPTDVQAVLKKAEALDALVKKTVPEDKQQEQNAEIDKKMNEIAADLAALPAKETPESKLSYGGLVGSFGAAASANYLDYNHDPGSHADSKLFDDEGKYADINERRQGGGAYYVRGHLLNDNVGGPGRDDWKNLTPLSQQANGDHKRDWENDLKIAVNGTASRILGSEKSNAATRKQQNYNGFARNVSIKAVYGRSEPTSLTQLKSDQDVDPPGWKDEWNITTIRRLLEAERGVPKRLICTATIKKHEQAETQHSKTIENDIGYGDLSKYSLNGAPRRKVVIGDLIKDSTTRQGAISTLESQISGLAQTGKAATVLDRLLEGKSLSSYQSVFGMTKEQLHEKNASKKFTFGKYSGANKTALSKATT